ncbi:putative proline-rich receptor-like protein kinase PERK8 [Iris pallida]|uniref:Proline-rich receptor-like protein kinase PERK8 n=1 Tax=Iris pallida TaxID=29817 RepID=A0AAX6H6D1_IRIPA|nr:putative proline-rich receptor-like protein kinase PERK8 [Iris pallida]KAJ6854190.1 putative proline-rich receptor-like protein kinase PERK8 [Iris pallida]
MKEIGCSSRQLGGARLQRGRQRSWEVRREGSVWPSAEVRGLGR